MIMKTERQLNWVQIKLNSVVNFQENLFLIMYYSFQAQTFLEVYMRELWTDTNAQLARVNLNWQDNISSVLPPPDMLYNLYHYIPLTLYDQHLDIMVLIDCDSDT